MSSVEIICPLCNNRMSVLTEYSNQQVTCPSCQKIITVPDLTPATPPVATIVSAQPMPMPAPAPMTPYNQMAAPRPYPQNYSYRRPKRFFSVLRIPFGAIVVIAVIVILLAIFWLGPERQKARMKSCKSKLHNIGIAIIMYGDPNKGYVPDQHGEKGFEQLLLGGYMGMNVNSITPKDMEKCFQCPSADESHYYYYLGGSNKHGSLIIGRDNPGLPIVICQNKHDKTVHVVCLGHLKEQDIRTFEVSANDLTCSQILNEIGPKLGCTSSKKWDLILENAKKYD